MDINTIKEFAEALIKEYCSQYRFEFSNGKKIHGYCNHTKRIVAISLPYTKVATQDQIFNTITHEIAHAIVGAREGHGVRWQQTHKSLGGDGKRCSTVAVTEGAKYFITCVKGCFIEPRFKKTRRSLTNYQCRICKGELYMINHKLTPQQA